MSESLHLSPATANFHQRFDEPEGQLCELKSACSYGICRAFTVLGIFQALDCLGSLG